MKNFVQDGDYIELTAPMGGVTSGVAIQVGKLVVVPTVTAAADERFNAATRGVFTVSKPGSQAWSEGQIVYFHDEDGTFTTSSGGNHQAGTAVEAVGSGAEETTGTVRLDGVSRRQG